MVLSKDDPEQYNLPDMFLNVQTNITQVLDLVKQINKMEEEIILNPMVYILIFICIFIKRFL